MPSDSGESIIRRLPDSVASQIAAGEVVQRPASVVKELVENSIDAGAASIDINLKDAGRTLIQVSDDGCGMSPADAAEAFERHATSKISSSDDLYSLHTMGFRGEALYSIAAVAEVELRTRRRGDEIGTKVLIGGGRIQSREAEACPEGTQISVRHLFFNVPARRKFLKSNETELRNVIRCFEQISLYYNNLAFSLSNNGSLIYKLAPEGRLQRIASVMGRKIGSSLLAIGADTPIVRISGFTGGIETAQKRGASQFFFANGRYIQHPYFAKAVANAYDKIIPLDSRPSFFIFLDVDPSLIDVNIHPAKTEVKFADEQSIFPLLNACVREALNKANLIPRLDFEGPGDAFIPELKDYGISLEAPKVSFDEGYDPFKGSGGAYPRSSKSIENWEKLYPAAQVETGDDTVDEPFGSLFNVKIEDEELLRDSLLIGGRYLAYSADGTLYIYNLYRAGFQLSYQRFADAAANHNENSRPLLFPDLLELTPADDLTFGQLRPVLEEAGFAFEPFGKHAYQITSLPDAADSFNARECISDMIAGFEEVTAREKLDEFAAVSLARHDAKSRSFDAESARSLVRRLRAQGNPRFTCQGKPIFKEISDGELKKLFNR